MAGEDYTALSRVLNFPAGERRVCFLVTILDDCVLEELEEFKLSLVEITGDSPTIDRVKIDAGEGRVMITDDQCECPTLPSR